MNKNNFMNRIQEYSMISVTYPSPLNHSRILFSLLQKFMFLESLASIYPIIPIIIPIIPYRKEEEHFRIFFLNTRSFIHYDKMISKLCLNWPNNLTKIRIRIKYNFIKFLYHSTRCKATKRPTT